MLTGVMPRHSEKRFSFRRICETIETIEMGVVAAEKGTVGLYTK